MVKYGGKSSKLGRPVTIKPCISYTNKIYNMPLLTQRSSHIQVYVRLLKKSKHTFLEILRFLYFLTQLLRQKCVREKKVKKEYLFSYRISFICNIFYQDILKIEWPVPIWREVHLSADQNFDIPNYAPGGWKKTPPVCISHINISYI